MIPNPCIEVQTSPVDRPSVPPWFAEVVIMVQHLATKGLLDAFAQQVRLVRGHFGSYEPIVNSNLKLLISAISKVSRVGKFKLAHSSASLKFPRTSVPKTLSLLSCIYKPSYLLSASIAPAPCVFREAEGPAFTGFAARSWKTPARRFSRRR